MSDDTAPHAGQAPGPNGLWRVAAEESEDAIFSLDADGRIVQWTAGATRLFGYRPEEIVGRSGELLLTAELREAQHARVARVIAGERVHRLSVRGQHRNGMSLLLSLTMVPLAGAGACVVVRDVSEREFAQATLAESEHRLQEAQELSHVGLWVWDATGDVVQMSDELYRIHGIDPREFDGSLAAFLELAEPSEQVELAEALGRAIAGEEPLEREYRILRPDGSSGWVYSRATRELDDAGQPIGLRGVCQDITDRRRASDVLTRQASMLDLLRGMAVAANEAETLEGALRSCLHAVCSHADWPVGHAVAVAAGRLADDGIWHIAEPRLEEFRDALRAESPGGGRLAQAVLTTRQPVWQSDLHREPRTADLDGAGLVTGFACPVFEQDQLVAVIEFYAADRREPDQQLMEATAHGANQLGHVVERTRAREALARQALHDALTELPNRTLFLDRLRHALQVLDREASHIAVLFIDLDNFKLINDSLGHDVGDRVLTTVSERLLRDMRAGDTTARFGGDEFMILCERLPNAEAAIDIAERLLAAVATPIDLGPDNVTVVNASAGIVITDDPTSKAEELIRDADAAMYRAKEAGGSRYQIFDRALHQQAARKLTVANDLRRALVNDELRLVYQPQVRLSDRSLIGIEALVRWQHPEQGLLPPSEFIAVAEQTHLIVPMGTWVLQEACRQLAQWRRLPGAAPLKMCVNVSAVQLATPDLLDVVAEALSSTGVEPATLCIEITESVLMADADAGLEALLALKMLGVGIAVDDFGTGYSSLAYLSRFPIDLIKIDKGFVDPLGHGDGRADSIVRAVVEMSRALGLTTLAEGVETEEQLADLIAIGCEAGQGYLFARPMPPEGVSALLTDSAAIAAPA